MSLESCNKLMLLNYLYYLVCRESGKKDNLFSARMALKSVISILKVLDDHYECVLICILL